MQKQVEKGCFFLRKSWFFKPKRNFMGCKGAEQGGIFSKQVDISIKCALKISR